MSIKVKRERLQNAIDKAQAAWSLYLEWTPSNQINKRLYDFVDAELTLLEQEEAAHVNSMAS
jgi:hypothetical protein